jgi:methylthioribose-1-phosphate isomerase
MSIESLPRTIEWIDGLDGHVRMIDQTRLPGELVFHECHDVDTMWEAIKVLRVRGAPAIGVAAAMGVVLGIRNSQDRSHAAFLAELNTVCESLASSRPTAVNLTWALDRQRRLVASIPDATIPELKQALLDEAKKIRDEDEAMCRAIGRNGESLITDGCGVLTHCNAGSLATAYYGTALAPMFTAHEKGRQFRVFADETRPLLQGARLTVWELMQAGIDATLLCDSMAATLMRQGKVSLVITGADRIAANGDTANKIGTYGVAVLARAHGIPFYIAAPTSTFDLSISDGSQIPIEDRSPDEIRKGFGPSTAPPDVKCFCPAFDVTPADFIEAMITERGIISPVTRENIAEQVSG